MYKFKLSITNINYSISPHTAYSNVADLYYVNMYVNISVISLFLISYFSVKYVINNK